MTGFTLTGFAFPVAPADLTGFMLDEFAWLTLAPAPAPTPINRVVFTLPIVQRQVFGS